MTIYLFDRVENIVGKGEIAGYQSKYSLKFMLVTHAHNTFQTSNRSIRLVQLERICKINIILILFKIARKHFWRKRGAGCKLSVSFSKLYFKKKK